MRLVGTNTQRKGGGSAMAKVLCTAMHDFVFILDTVSVCMICNDSSYSDTLLLLCYVV